MVVAAIVVVARAGKGSRAGSCSRLRDRRGASARRLRRLVSRRERALRPRGSLRPLPVWANRDVRGFLLRFRVPAKERSLCPDEPLGQRWHPYYYVSGSCGRPYWHIPKKSRERLAGQFAQRAIIHQPLDYARTVAEDVLLGFAPTRRTTRPGQALWRWQFQPYHPLYVGNREPPYMHASPVRDGAARHGGGATCEASRAEWTRIVERFGNDELTVEPTLARWLTTYRGFAFVPGPLLVLALALGAAGALVAGRRRETSRGLLAFSRRRSQRSWSSCRSRGSTSRGDTRSSYSSWSRVCGSIGLTALVPRWRHESGPADPS